VFGSGKPKLLYYMIFVSLGYASMNVGAGWLIGWCSGRDAREKTCQSWASSSIEKIGGPRDDQGRYAKVLTLITLGNVAVTWAISRRRGRDPKLGRGWDRSTMPCGGGGLGLGYKVVALHKVAAGWGHCRCVHVGRMSEPSRVERWYPPRAKR
jgi:hypothetical protein